MKKENKILEDEIIRLEKSDEINKEKLIEKLRKNELL